MRLDARRSRGITFAGVRIRIDASGTESAGLVDLLFRDMTDDRPDVPASSHFVVQDLEPGAGISMRGDGECFHEGPDLGDAALKLQEAVSVALAGGCTSGLVLHAAAVARGSNALILPGKSGSGKTTLSAHLMAYGFKYLSDEMTFLPSGTLRVEGLPRPLSVKSAGLHLVATEGVANDAWARLNGPAATIMQPPATVAEQGGADGQPVVQNLSAIVFPQFEAGAPAVCERLSTAQAGLRLMATLLNARNLDGHGFPAVTTLVRDVPAYLLRFGDVRDALPLLAELT